MEATLVVLLDLWQEKDGDYAPSLAFLDLLVAFDTIDQGILLDQLRELRVGDVVLCWFTSFLHKIVG